jgi:CRISPR/Cas system-associated endoribonuclease Cas2
MNKPIFELTDVELKSIAYDITRDIKRLQENIELIEMELQRRKNSVVATMTQQEFINSVDQQ